MLFALPDKLRRSKLNCTWSEIDLLQHPRPRMERQISKVNIALWRIVTLKLHEPFAICLANILEWFASNEEYGFLISKEAFLRVPSRAYCEVEISITINVSHLRCLKIPISCELNQDPAADATPAMCRILNSEYIVKVDSIFPLISWWVF